MAAGPTQTPKQADPTWEWDVTVRVPSAASVVFASAIVFWNEDPASGEPENWPWASDSSSSAWALADPEPEPAVPLTD